MGKAAGRVLVLDGETNQALACVRSLGRAGFDVFVGSLYRWPLAAWSRHSREVFRLPEQTTEAYGAVRAWARERAIGLVLPLSEAACALCNAERDAWTRDGITLGCGPDDILGRAFDKGQTIDIARRCGVAVPPTRVADSIAGYRAAALELGFPCIVKSRFSNARSGNTILPDEGVAYVSDLSTLDRAVSARRLGDQWPLLQRLVPGVGAGVFALCDHGRVIAWFAHRRLRDVRPTGSGSSLRCSAPLDPRLRAASERLLRAMEWHGPAMVEFRDDGGREPWLMEVNGRFWGSLQLAVAAGVDFPLLWTRILRGETVAAGPYAEGITLRWLWGDVKRFLNVLRGPPTGYRGPYPSVWQGLRELLGPQPPGTRNETWQRDDPWPAAGEWIQGAVELITRRRVGRPRPARPAAAIPDAAPANQSPVGTGGRDIAGPPVRWAPATSVTSTITLHRHRPHTATAAGIRVLMLTGDWPTPGSARTTHFIKRQAEFLQAAGVEVDVFHYRAQKNPRNYLSAWTHVRRRIAQTRYDLVHAQWGQSGILALPKHIPLVVTLRGDDIGGIVGSNLRVTPVGRVLRGISGLVAREADAVIVVSEHMKAFLHPSVQAHVIPSGLDLELFRPIPQEDARRRLGLPLDRRLALFVGNPATPRKRYALAQQAVDIVNRSMPAELVVAWGIQHADIPLYLNACDVLLFTSMQEGSPNAVKEALACNLPVVATPVGDVAERLREAEGCELCSDQRPDRIAAALERVLRRRRRAGSRSAVEHLDERRTTQQVIAVYRSVLRQHTSVHPVVAPRDVFAHGGTRS